MSRLRDVFAGRACGGDDTFFMLDLSGAHFPVRARLGDHPENC